MRNAGKNRQVGKSLFHYLGDLKAPGKSIAGPELETNKIRLIFTNFPNYLTGNLINFSMLMTAKSKIQAFEKDKIPDSRLVFFLPVGKYSATENLCLPG